MQVHSYTVPESVITAVNTRMKSIFTASDLEDEAIKAGAPKKLFKQSMLVLNIAPVGSLTA